MAAKDKKWQPMLAYSPEADFDFHILEQKGHFPMWGSYKIDGIRATCHPELGLRTRTMAVIPSAYAQRYGDDSLAGIDGELIVVDHPPGDTLYHASYSAVMTHGSQVPLKWMVFDYYPGGGLYCQRIEKMEEMLRNSVYEVPAGFQIETLEQRELADVGALLAMEQEALDAGHEGLIVRRPDAPYKNGRSTLNEGYLIKVARWLRSEAEIIGFEERMHNENPQSVDARGYSKRSTHKENLTPMGTLGALQVRDTSTGAVFKIGTGDGLDDALRLEIWTKRELYLGRLVTFKYKPYGTKDLPRHPIFLGFRSREDM